MRVFPGIYSLFFPPSKLLPALPSSPCPDSLLLLGFPVPARGGGGGQESRMKRTWALEASSLGQDSDPSSCVSSGKSLAFSESWFPNL